MISVSNIIVTFAYKAKLFMSSENVCLICVNFVSNIVIVTSHGVLFFCWVKERQRIVFFSALFSSSCNVLFHTQTAPVGLYILCSQKASLLLQRFFSSPIYFMSNSTKAPFSWKESFVGEQSNYSTRTVFFGP